MIMSGTSLRRPGVPGRLGLFAAAAVLLPIGASWAQKPDEKPVGKFIVLSPEKIDTAFAPEEQAKVDSSETMPAQLVVELTGSLNGPVDLGSLDDVVKKLEALIIDLKKQGDSRPEAKAQAEALVKALEGIKGTKDVPVTVRFHSDAKAGDDANGLGVVVRGKLGVAAPQAENAERIAQARQEVAKLRKELDATLDRLKKAQARLHELGEDGGESPVVRWQRLASPPVHREITAVRPRASKEIRYTIVRPIRPEAPASDQERLNLVEKRLKELQQEFERLKKGSVEAGEKK